MYRFNQHSFVGGQLDRGLMGRQDLERYFQGASKLENFIVRKQGNITKRRGTEMIADFANLFGNGDAIAYSRLIPMAQDISAGYYILFAESVSGKRGSFLISDNGIQCKVKTKRILLDADGNPSATTEESESIRFSKTTRYADEYTQEIEGEDATVQRWKIAEEATPNAIEIPYAGSEFNEIGFNQSGDTVFLVHKNYPPAKIVYDGTSVSYSTLDFASQKWHSPRILSVTPSGTWGSTTSTKTISYVATYVKDGVESMPSAEFQISYKLPWGNTCSMEIKVDKGNNETEPDYYNIYKKDASEFGLLATADTARVILAYPGLKSGTTIGCFTGSGQFGSPLKESTTTDISALLNRSEYSSPYDSAIGNTKGTHIRYGQSMTLDFGSSYGKVVTGMTLLSDYIVLSRYDLLDPTRRIYGVSYYIGISSPRFKFTMGFGEIGSSTTEEVSVSINSSVPSSLEYKGNGPLGSGTIAVSPSEKNTWSYSGQNAAPADVQLSHYRKIEASFTQALSDAGYTKGGDKRIETRYIKVEAYTDATETTAGVICLDGVSFESNWGSTDTFQDDYITPNLAFTPPQDGGHFERIGDYPSCVAMYTQRLAFAATKNQPFTWWMSCVGDLYNFNVHASIRQDDAMEVTVPATEFPNINHMVLLRDLVLFCDNGEWVVRPLSGNTLAFDTVECKKQSAVGCAKSVPPLQVGDEIIFADNSKRVVRSIKYQFTSDGYESNDLSILSQSLFFSNPVISMCYKKHPESLILCELSDGTIAALVYMKEHNVVAWTHHTLGGGWKCRGIASNKAHADETTHVAMLVEHPDGGVEVWRIRDDDESSNLADQLCMDGLRFALGSEIGAAAFENGQSVIDLENGQRLNATAELEAKKEYAVGYPFTSTFVSVRPEPQGAETFQWELKNAKKVHIRTLNGSSFTVKEAGMSDDYASPVDIGRSVAGGEITVPGLVDATDILLNGENSRDGRIEIKHDGILPLTIESFSVDYETQPLYESEG